LKAQNLAFEVLKVFNPWKVVLMVQLVVEDIGPEGGR